MQTKVHRIFYFEDGTGLSLCAAEHGSRRSHLSHLETGKSGLLLPFGLILNIIYLTILMLCILKNS